MRTLAIETATQACSVALFAGEELLAARHEVLGRGHAELLVPLIAELPDRGKAERIFVSLGPGSFTGTRIGIAAAKALGLAWRAEVLGYPTLQLVALSAQQQLGAEPVLVAMSGGHGEWLVQPFSAPGAPLGDHHSLSPAEAALFSGIEQVAGSVAQELVERRDFGEALPILPDARHAVHLASTCLIEAIRPIYARAPDAKLPSNG